MVIKLHCYVPVNMTDNKGILCSNTFITLFHVDTVVCEFYIPEHVFHDESVVFIHDRDVKWFDVRKTFTRTEC
mgnify:CR=1 FL=1